MENDRRKVIPRQRAEMINHLNDEQRFELRRYEQFGWELQFVRHPLFDRPIPILCDADSGEMALLESDGTLNQDHDITIRTLTD